MSKNLVIVESPAKAKTIEKYLGPDFVVKSSVGHIRGLPSKDGSIDVANNFQPIFEISADKKKVVAELKKAAKVAETVWLAADQDREGEAIAWHLRETLKLDPAKTRRIIYSEITKKAVSHAIANPGKLNLELVEAQQARQALDYLVGFELSPVLWRKVRPKLSAGRVQSVAVRLIVDREKELESFTPKSSFKLEATFTLADGTELASEAPVKFDDAKQVEKILEDYSKSDFKLSDITKKPGTRSPSAPFTTSTLQQEASSKLGLSPRNTMSLAQRLYESGHITYMRTDSMNISGDALSAMTSFIKQQFGDKYHQVRAFKTKSASAQEAHEAIRPTDFRNIEAGADELQTKLYKLIWRRTLASQMAAAELEKTTMTISASQSDQVLEAKGEIVIFDGFLKIYPRASEDKLLPDIHANDPLDLKIASATENISRGPARYTEATLVKKMEEMGIGRPSTYASTIATIQARDYVERGDIEGVEKGITVIALADGTVETSHPKINYGQDSNKLIPTDTGVVVTDFLVKHFEEVMAYDFTKEVELELDEIAEGKKKRVEVLRHFYDPFHSLIEASADISRSEATQSRKVGDDPKSGRPIFARYGRFGPMLQKGEKEDEDKPIFAQLPKGAKIETVTLDQALEMFKLPRQVGETEDGQPMMANIGRFGPYVKVDNLYVSIKPLDPMTITEAEARQLYTAKLEKEKNKYIRKFDSGISIINGPYGPYITDGKKNARIPKDQKPEDLDEAACKALIAAAPARGKKRSFKRKPAKK